MKWSIATLLLFLTLLLDAQGSGRNSRPKRKERISHEAIAFPGASVEKCPSDSSCVPMEKCPSEFKNVRQKRPTICKWEVDSPLICCPRIGTNAALKKSPTRFPEGDCARNEVVKIKLLKTSGGRLSLVKRQLNQGFHGTVVGGTNVKFISSYPFMAAIYQTSGKEKMFLCGGTLLSKTVILTAAHCFLSMDKTSTYMVQMGSVRAQIDGSIANLPEFEVTSVVLHPGFQYPILYNDIALIKFKGLTEYSTSIRPICLMSKAEDRKATTKLTILGWGSKKSGGSQSSELQEADLNVISNSNCNATLGKMGALTVSFPGGINTKVMCAGSPPNVSRDACQGDSGGPATILIDGIWRQRGVVSGGIGCGIPGNPGLYTRVSEYVTWIQENA
ncbi:Transmembrane protease serine 9 [Chamberlinius hualienensis]